MDHVDQGENPITWEALDDWQRAWAARLDAIDPAASQPTDAEIRDGLLRGVEFLLAEQALVPQWLEALGSPERSHGSQGQALLDGVQTLNRLINLLPGSDRLAADIGMFALSLAGVAGSVSALADTPVAEGGIAALRRQQTESAMRTSRGSLDRYLPPAPLPGGPTSVSDPASPPETLAQRITSYLTTPVSAANSPDTGIRFYRTSPTLAHWKTRLLALDQLGSDPVALSVEVTRGRALLAVRLRDLQRELANPTEPNEPDKLPGWYTALEETRELLGHLVAVDSTLPEKLSELSTSVADLSLELTMMRIRQESGASQLGVVRSRRIALHLGSARAALADAAPFLAEPLEENLPRLTLHGRLRKWPSVPEYHFNRWPTEPDIPTSGTWDELRPHLLAYTEFLMEKLPHAGPRLAEKYQERVEWIETNVGSIAEQVGQYPFDTSEIAFRFVSPQVFLRERFRDIDSAHSERAEPLGPTEIEALLDQLREPIPEATYGIGPETPGGERTGTILFVTWPRDGSNLNTPPSDARLAINLFHEWRHHVQTRLALSGRGDYADVMALLDYPPMVEGDAAEVANRVLMAAAVAGALAPDEVSSAIRDEVHAKRFKGSPDRELYGRGLTENRVITLGLKPDDRQAVLDHIMANPRELGRQEGESLADWGQRVRDRLTAGDPAAVPEPQQLTSRHRVWRPGTVVPRPQSKTGRTVSW